MKANKLTPGSNLLWESSRMMLPEHKEALGQYAQESKKQVRPILDEQELEEINKLIQQAYASQARLRLVIFNEYGHKVRIGWVTRVEQEWQRLLLAEDEEREWISFQDILDAAID